MAVKGMSDIPGEVVELFKDTYPHAGSRLEFATHIPRGEVIKWRMLLKAFYDGYRIGKEVED